MTTDPRSRVATLVGLALVGVALAVAGTSVGATTPLTDTGSTATFVVSDRNVTFEHGDQRATVVDDMTRVDQVEIERRGGGTYRVNTETEQPVTDDERSRAKTIARNNATVRRSLEELDRYELAVEPIRKLTVDSARTMNVTGFDEATPDGETAGGQETYTVSVEDRDGSVTVDRDPTYVQGEVSVRVRDPVTDETYYTVTVDLKNGTVTGVTDWTAV